MRTTTTDTAQQIAAQLRDDLAAAEYQQLLRSITARRVACKSRLELVEPPGAAYSAALQSADPDQVIALTREAEAVDAELGILYDLESRIHRLHTRALEREAVEAGDRALKQLASVLSAAEKATAAASTARAKLEETLSAISAGRDQARDAQRFAATGDAGDEERFLVSDANFRRIADVLFANWSDDRRIGALHGLKSRICAPAPAVFGDVEPDYAEQARRG